MSLKDDFVAVLNDMLVEQAVLIKESRTTDSFGNVTAITLPKITIECSIQPVTQKNWNVIEMGLPVSGTMVGYFKPTYTQFCTDYEVEEGDKIEWNNTLFRVEEIMSAPEHGSKVVFIKARLVRI